MSSTCRELKMPFPKITTFLLMLAASKRLCANELIQKSGVDSLFHLGSVDGQDYYIERNQTMTWPEARDYCKEMGLELVTIRTAYTSDFLIQSLNETVGALGSWTAAHEDRSASGFIWDSSDFKPNPFLFKWEHVIEQDYIACAYVFSWNGGSSTDYKLYLRADLCSKQFYVLCQS